ncbi:transposase [Cyanobium sp. Morenito 9A2]|uniref:transposase n=1 Tax=Cyanobium sp. Morenito 9A2 TaxID=2823718 RepID=UPI0020CC0052|nr:transposase [Cyanobium sp. Morenito 9A2]MCP9848789.1 transposase [Cyanobium sp. Morenito 9A2]
MLAGSKKNGISHYGYKNASALTPLTASSADAPLTAANIHESQLLTQVIDPKKREDLVWADSGYAGAGHEDLLEMAGFESRIHEKGSRCLPLGEEAKDRNKVRSSVRARVEHVFAAITTGMLSKMTRRIG